MCCFTFSYQDSHSQGWCTNTSCWSWVGFRLDTVCVLFMISVAAGAFYVKLDAGRFECKLLRKVLLIMYRLYTLITVACDFTLRSMLNLVPLQHHFEQHRVFVVGNTTISHAISSLVATQHLTQIDKYENFCFVLLFSSESKSTKHLCSAS